MSKKSKQQQPTKTGGFISVHQAHKKDCRFISNPETAGFQQPYKRPRKLTQEEFDAQVKKDTVVADTVDNDMSDDFLEDDEQTQVLPASAEASDAEEESDDEGDFRSLAHDVIQKNGYRTVLKWFELEAEPFKPVRKPKAEK